MSRMAGKSSGRRPRRQFSEEFKAGAVRLVLDEGKTVGAVARVIARAVRRALRLWRAPKPAVAQRGDDSL